MDFPLSTVIYRPRHCDPLYLLRELGRERQYCALLESASRNDGNDLSFVALGARDVIRVQNGEIRGSGYAPDGNVRDTLSVFRPLIKNGAKGGRLQMGYIGFLSFEAARQFEDIDLKPDPEIPDAFFVLPEVLIKIDHDRREVTVITHKDSPEDPDAIKAVIHSSSFRNDGLPPKKSAVSELPPLPTLDEIEPFRATSREAFCQSVRSIRQGILAGETFQVVLSQELNIESDVDPLSGYEQLRTLNPSPYMYYFQTPERTLVGASPETLVRVERRNILYRPIAGTRKRTGDERQDKKMRTELLQDEKERCEHQMLVDLGRNDIGKVAEVGSVKVKNPFHIETFTHLYHIVSDITARLRIGLSPLDALRAVFPAGTLTGAPKMRAMEVIRSLERSPRGIYGGAFGYIDLSGNLDFAIMIRTMEFCGGRIRLRVGAGIVKDSIPEHEDNECLHKARSSIAAIRLARPSPSLS